MLAKDKLILKLIEEDEIKIDMENEKVVTLLRHFKSREWKELKNSREKAGCIEHSVYRYGKRIRIRQHRLVWIYVHRKIPSIGYVVHHIDESRRNNHISNLELLSRKDHLVHNGMYPSQKLTNMEIRQLLKEYKKVAGKQGGNRRGEVQALADKYDIYISHISRLANKEKENKGA